MKDMHHIGTSALGARVMVAFRIMSRGGKGFVSNESITECYGTIHFRCTIVL